jgi:hypothetical protein
MKLSKQAYTAEFKERVVKRVKGGQRRGRLKRELEIIIKAAACFGKDALSGTPGLPNRVSRLRCPNEVSAKIK